MGAGIPTTALYIMLVSVAQPALAQLGVAAHREPHVRALLRRRVGDHARRSAPRPTPRRAIANANPFRTGISAFSLGLGKVVAPMGLRLRRPVLLFVSSTGFDWVTFSYTAASAIAGVVCLSAAGRGLRERADRLAGAPADRGGGARVHRARAVGADLVALRDGRAGRGDGGGEGAAGGGLT